MVAQCFERVLTNKNSVYFRVSLMRIYMLKNLCILFSKKDWYIVDRVFGILNVENSCKINTG